MAYMFVTLYARSDNAHFKVFMSQICFWNPIVNGIKIMAFLTTGRIGKILPIFKISHPVKRISPKHFPQYILCSRERFGNKVMRDAIVREVAIGALRSYPILVIAAMDTFFVS